MRNANRATDIEALLRSRMSAFGTLIPCDGIVTSLQGRCSAEGMTLTEVSVPASLRFAQGVAEGHTWTSSPSTAHAPARDHAGDASGVLVIPMSQRSRDSLMLFRREVVGTLDGAGDPNETCESGPNGERLTPRKSFAVWKETVRQQSQPWTEQDRQFGEPVCAAVIEVVPRTDDGFVPLSRPPRDRPIPQVDRLAPHCGGAGRVPALDDSRQ